MLLDGKSVIVTGASSGIGAAAGRLFARHGAHVILGARRKSRLQHIANEISAENGSTVFLAGDVRDEGYAEALVDLAISSFGRLDGALNNAGMMGEISPVPSMAPENWRNVIDTNLTSAFYAAKHQIPAMAGNGGGSIIFTSSFVGFSNGGLPGMGAYAASKAGLIGLTQSLARDHGHAGVRVNALLPGGTKTEMAGEDPDALEFIASLHPLGRMAQPEEIAEAALFLLSSLSTFVTGSAMLADGGLSTRLA